MKKMIQPEALKVGANRISANDARSVKLDFAPMEGNEKSQYCFFVCTTFDSFLNDLLDS